MLCLRVVSDHCILGDRRPVIAIGQGRILPSGNSDNAGLDHKPYLSALPSFHLQRLDFGICEFYYFLSIQNWSTVNFLVNLFSVLFIIFVTSICLCLKARRNLI